MDCKRGLKAAPCGTPLVMQISSAMSSPILILVVLSSRKLYIHLIVIIGKFNEYNF